MLLSEISAFVLFFDKHFYSKYLVKFDFPNCLCRVFSLYEKWGHENYIGEAVSQLQHAQQV